MKYRSLVWGTIGAMVLGFANGYAAGPVPSTKPGTLEGDWSGVLQLPGLALPLVIHLETNAASFDSPAQGASRIPLAIARKSPSGVTLESPALQLKMDLVLDPVTGNLAGSFEQGAVKTAISFEPGLAALPPKIKPQEPKPPFPYEVRELDFLSADGKTRLAGSLTLPSGKDRLLALVLVSGSGPQDRDETILGHKPFWVIADALARAGIAVLRYDDRGVGKSQGDFATATTADFAQDAQGAVVALRQAMGKRAGKIGMLGHSEGGLVAPMVEARFHSLDFMVLLAAPGVDIIDLMLRQNADISRLSGVAEEQLADNLALSRQMYELAASQATSQVIQSELHDILAKAGLSEADIAPTMAPVLSPWFRYFIAIKPAEALARIKVPVLALGGDKDSQVWAEGNLAAIRQTLTGAGNLAVTVKLYTGLNHLFQHADSGLPVEYATIPETISPEVLDDIKNWILGLK